MSESQTPDLEAFVQQIKELRAMALKEKEDPKKIEKLRDNLENQIRALGKEVHDNARRLLHRSTNPPADGRRKPSRPRPSQRTPAQKRNKARGKIVHVAGQSAYELPKTPEELRNQLRIATPIGTLALHFSDQVLEEVMRIHNRVSLQCRADFAVLCALKDKVAPLEVHELEKLTGYNLGSVEGVLGRLQDKSLIRKRKSNEQALLA